LEEIIDSQHVRGETLRDYERKRTERVAHNLEIGRRVVSHVDERDVWVNNEDMTGLRHVVPNRRVLQ
jgi:hypothetical protein